MAAGLHISISAEKVLSLGGLNISNSMLTSIVVSGLLIGFAVWVNFSLKKTSRPTGAQNFAEFVIESLTSLIQSVTNSKIKTDRFFPFIATFFLFILLNNWLGLVPGVGTVGFYEGGEGVEHAQLAPSTLQAKLAAFAVSASTPKAIKEDTHTTETVPTEPAATHETAQEEKTEAHRIFVPYFRAGTADLNTTLALGLVSMGAVQFFGFLHLGPGYLKKFFNFSNPINTFVGLLELISDFSKVISFAFRLFGNVFAGEVLLAVIGFLVPVIVPMPFYGLEIFVGFIQALVFAMLSSVFFNMATLGHDEH